MPHGCELEGSSSGGKLERRGAHYGKCHPLPIFFLYSERLAPLHVGKISLAVNLKFKTTRSPTTVSIFSMDNRGKFLC